MGFLIILLTLAMVLDCMVLILLVLMQLPKKEAGAGLAFGAGATDALFGAGSGNFLTKTTKYAATIFFCLAVVLSLLEGYRSRQGRSEFQRQFEQQQSQSQTPIQAPSTATAPNNTAPAAPALTPSTNLLLSAPESTPAAPTSPAPAAPTNSAPKSSK